MTHHIQNTFLTFDKFQDINKMRCEQGFKHPVESWEPKDWAIAIAGEAGELCNVIKKITRGDFTLEEKRNELVKEVADIMIYCDLMMTRLNGMRRGFNPWMPSRMINWSGRRWTRSPAVCLPS